MCTFQRVVLTLGAAPPGGIDSEAKSQEADRSAASGGTPQTSSPVGTVIRPLSRVSPNTPITSDRMNKSLLDICIYLPDMRGLQFSIDGGRLATASYLESIVCQHVGVDEQLARQLFAIWMISPIMGTSVLTILF